MEIKSDKQVISEKFAEISEIFKLKEDDFKQ